MKDLFTQGCIFECMEAPRPDGSLNGESYVFHMDAAYEDTKRRSPNLMTSFPHGCFFFNGYLVLKGVSDNQELMWVLLGTDIPVGKPHWIP